MLDEANVVDDEHSVGVDGAEVAAVAGFDGEVGLATAGLVQEQDWSALVDEA